MQHITTATSLLVALSLTTSLTAQAASDAAVAKHKHWVKPAFTLEVAETAPHIARADVISALTEAAGAWYGVGTGPAIDVVEAEKAGGAHPVRLDGKNRVGVWQQGPWPYPAQAGAVTVAYSAKGSDVISEVDIALNPAFSWTRDPLVDDDRYDLANVLTHEIGHALGLPDIQNFPEATMFYVIGNGETMKRDLHEHDEGKLIELYEGIDMSTPTGCSSTGRDAPALAVTLLALLSALRRRRPGAR